MDYKILSPSEYFGSVSGPMGNNNIFISQNMVQHPHHHHQIHSHNHGNDGALNVLANGAVAAASVTPSQGYPYPSNPTDNYGYIVRRLIMRVV